MWETTLSGMRVERLDMGRYLCRSETEDETTYTVDLKDNEALGSCDCPQFRYRHFPRWKTVQQPYPAFMCKHILQLRQHVMTQILQHYINKAKRKE